MSSVRSLMRLINTSIYEPRTRVGLTPKQLKAQSEAADKFKKPS